MTRAVLNLSHVFGFLCYISVPYRLLWWGENGVWFNQTVTTKERIHLLMASKSIHVNSQQFTVMNLVSLQFHNFISVSLIVWYGKKKKKCYWTKIGLHSLNILEISIDPKHFSYLWTSSLYSMALCTFTDLYLLPSNPLPSFFHLVLGPLTLNIFYEAQNEIILNCCESVLYPVTKTHNTCCKRGTEFLIILTTIVPCVHSRSSHNHDVQSYGVVLPWPIGRERVWQSNQRSPNPSCGLLF